MVMLSASSWCCRTHQDVVSAFLSARYVARNRSLLVHLHNAVNIMIMLLNLVGRCLRVYSVHHAEWLWYHHDAAFTSLYHPLCCSHHRDAVRIMVMLSA